MRCEMPGVDLSCAVCGQVKAQRCFGAVVCSGCASFFRKTVRDNLHYECRNENNCIVDLWRRNRCRQCRYQKCLDSGLQIKAVQQRRDRNGHNRKLCSCCTHVETGIEVTQEQHGLCQVKQPLQLQGSEIVVSPGQILLTSTTTSLSPDEFAYNSVLQEALQFDAYLTEAISQYRYSEYGQAHYNYHTVTTGALGLPDFDTILPIECRMCLFNVILKQMLLPLVNLTSYRTVFASLPLADQITLLRSFAPIYTLLSDQNRSARLGNTLELILIDNVHIYRADNEVVFVLKSTSKICVEVTRLFRATCIDSVEFALLQNIIFWNADIICDWSSKNIVRQQQFAYIVALEQYIRQKQQGCSVGRHGQLFLLLRFIEKCAANFRYELENLRYHNISYSSAMEPLVHDLFINEDSFPGPCFDYD